MHVRIREEISHVIVLDVTIDDSRVGAKADENEHPGRGEIAGRIGVDIAQLDVAHQALVVAVDRVDDRVPDDLHLRVGEQTLLQDL